jgi:hypothetical protein
MQPAPGMRERASWSVRAVAVFCVAVVSGCIWVQPTEPVRDEYEPCEADSQCPSGDACWSVTIVYGHDEVTDSFCTSPCTWDWDCPYDGSCQAPDAGPPLCYARCFDDLDCYAGFACDLEAYDPVCIPW